MGDLCWFGAGNCIIIDCSAPIGLTVEAMGLAFRGILITESVVILLGLDRPMLCLPGRPAWDIVGLGDRIPNAMLDTAAAGAT